MSAAKKPGTRPGRKVAKRPPAGRKATKPVPARAATTTKPLILVVDDFDDGREMYAEFLAFSGFRVVEARDGHEALRQAVQALPALILMDLSLPGMDGWEATRRLKRDPRTQKIPVIALTGHALAGYDQGAREAGCDGFLAKPCPPDEVVRVVRATLGKPAGTRKRSPRP